MQLQFSHVFNKLPYAKKMPAFLLAIASLCAAPTVFAQEDWALQLGEFPNCTKCHNNQPGFGKEDAKAAAKQAYRDGGVIPGLQDYLKSLNTNTVPKLLPIKSEWNTQVGETALSIPLVIKDDETSGFIMSLTKALPSIPAKSYKFSSIYTDAANKLPAINFNWTPTAAQKKVKYSVSFSVKDSAKQSSTAVNTSIYLWAARKASSKNVVSQFTLDTAKWASHKLILTGQVLFKKSATAAARTAALKALKLNLQNIKGATVVTPVLHLKPNATTGAWTVGAALADNKVPCQVKAEYEGLINVLTVKSAPATCSK